MGMLPGPKITILIPVFNRPELIRKTLKCVSAQTYSNFEVIVYDDGSTDSTSQVVSQFKNVCLIKSSENKGVAFARNRLLDACNTEYACWWDSDDLCNIKRLEMQVKELQKGFDIVFTTFKSFRQERLVNWREQPKSKERPVACASMMFKVDKEIRFQEQLRFGGEDYKWSRLMQLKYDKRSHVPFILYYVRYHPNRIGRIRRKLTAKDKQKSFAEVMRQR